MNHRGGESPASARGLSTPVLALTLGDPCGIGPEVVLRALAALRGWRGARFVIVGTDGVLRAVKGAFGIRWADWTRTDGSDLHTGFTGAVPLLHVGRACERLALKGRPTFAGGKSAAMWIEAAVDLALAGQADAVVTAPISKEALALAGETWPGHTEMIGAMTGARTPVMMMVAGGLRVALVTTHLAIKDVPRRITACRVLDTIRVTAADLRRLFGIQRPRLAVCGLNPHSGEAGRFGREEQTAIAPAIAAARTDGIDCAGPVPADVAFIPEKRRAWDAVVAMFHDQATIPVKMAAFDRGVNVTLGLPIIRTSPDHGTAYDIAARGVANPGSMIAAIRLAARMVRASRRAK